MVICTNLEWENYYHHVKSPKHILILHHGFMHYTRNIFYISLTQHQQIFISAIIWNTWVDVLRVCIEMISINCLFCAHPFSFTHTVASVDRKTPTVDLSSIPAPTATLYSSQLTILSNIINTNILSRIRTRPVVEHTLSLRTKWSVLLLLECLHSGLQRKYQIPNIAVL